MNKNKAEEFRFQAALAGKELNSSPDEALEQTYDPKIDAYANEAMKRFLKERKK